VRFLIGVSGADQAIHGFLDVIAVFCFSNFAKDFFCSFVG